MQSLTLLLAAFAPTVLSKVLEVTDSLPDDAVPFVVRHLEGPKFLLVDDVFRTLADTKNTINGSENTVAAGFSMLLTNGKPNTAVTPHYHVRWHETFLPITGTVRVWVNGRPRDLGAGDFAMAPRYTNHSWQFVAQESEFLGMIQPAGFDEFFQNVSAKWTPAYSVPFPPDQGIALSVATYKQAEGPYDINEVNMTQNEIGACDTEWHESNSTLPANSTTPYFLANGAGPHYWYEQSGAVISPLATTVQTGGNFTISQVSMRKTAANATVPVWSSKEHQFIYGMNGEVTFGVEGEDVKLIPGDSLFIPAYTSITVKSSVNYNKFLWCSGGADGVDSQMIKQGVSWAYSTPPAH